MLSAASRELPVSARRRHPSTGKVELGCRNAKTASGFHRAVANQKIGVGSSPHMRETRDGKGQIRRHPRFIPAHAGNAGRARKRARCWAVHPRTCGKRVIAFRCRTSLSGSSPHMRETLGSSPRETLFRETSANPVCYS